MEETAINTAQGQTSLRSIESDNGLGRLVTKYLDLTNHMVHRRKTELCLVGGD